MRVRLLFAVMLLTPVPVAAQTPAAAPAATRAPFAAQMLAGSWALRVDGAIVFRFDLASAGSGWSGSWTRPTSFVTDGASFGTLSAPLVEQKAASGRAIGDWVELSFADLRSGALPDIFRFHLVAPDKAELIYADTGLAPFELERVAPGTEPGPWAAGRVYRLPGVTPGLPIHYNVAPPLAPNIPPRRAPAETQGPPAIEGR